MRKQLDKIKKFYKGISLNLHRNVLSIEDNTMFVIVNIWRILESPLAVINSDGNDPVVFSCRVIQSSCISLIFHAELAFWITALFCILCSGNSLWIFFRLGKVNGDIYGSIGAFHSPAPVFLYAVTADIIGILTEFIEKFCSRFRAFLVLFPEFFLNLGRTGNQAVHDFGVKQIPVANTIFNNPSFYCLI